MRGDIVVNNLVAYAYATGEVRMQSDGTPWRPLAHVEDIAAAFIAALEAPRDVVHNEAFNIGRDEDNHQIRDLARMVEATVPDAKVTFAPGASPDKRSYRVDFAKSARLFTPRVDRAARDRADPRRLRGAAARRSRSSSPPASSASAGSSSWWRRASSTPTCAGACRA